MTWKDTAELLVVRMSLIVPFLLYDAHKNFARTTPAENAKSA